MVNGYCFEQVVDFKYLGVMSKLICTIKLKNNCKAQSTRKYTYAAKTYFGNSVIRFKHSMCLTSMMITLLLYKYIFCSMGFINIF